jgi:hypothetical protein
MERKLRLRWRVEEFKGDTVTDPPPLPSVIHLTATPVQLSTMSREDAVEIVLSKPLYSTCPYCERGRYRGAIRNPMECVTCNGWALVPNPEYVNACKVLGKEPPPPMQMSRRMYKNISFGQAYGMSASRMSSPQPNLQNPHSSRVDWVKVMMSLPAPTVASYSETDATLTASAITGFLSNTAKR